MRRIDFYFPFLAICASLLSCQRISSEDQSSGKSFYATIEEETKVHADEDLFVRWDADDRISVFDRSTLNEEYRFTGETGVNAGWFEQVPHGGFSTGNALDLVYAVSPYRAGTSIGEDGSLKVELPAEQVYRPNTFGPGANMMVSVTNNNRLNFRNACGYLVLKLYGEGIEVSSIALQGSFSEPIAGEAAVSMNQEGIPSLTMGPASTSVVTLTCAEPVALPADPEDAVAFWFALPPMVFEHGYTAVVTGSDGQTYYPFTKKIVKIPRNRKVTMAPCELRGNAPGQVTVANNTVCNLWLVSGKNEEGFQHWDFSTGENVCVRLDSWRCRCVGHIGYHVTRVELSIPGCNRTIPLERITGDDYISGNKGIAGAHLNKYSISNDGTSLEFDLTITPYLQTEGEIRIVYSGPIQ